MVKKKLQVGAYGTKLKVLVQVATKQGFDDESLCNLLGLARPVHMVYTVYDRIFGEFPANPTDKVSSSSIRRIARRVHFRGFS